MFGRRTTKGHDYSSAGATSVMRSKLLPLKCDRNDIAVVLLRGVQRICRVSCTKLKRMQRLRCLEWIRRLQSIWCLLPIGLSELSFGAVYTFRERGHHCRKGLICQKLTYL